MYGNAPVAWDDNLQGVERLRVIVNAFTRLRYCSAEGEMEFHHKGAPGTQPAGWLPWFEVPGRKSAAATIIIGHWSTLGLINRGEWEPLAVRTAQQDQLRQAFDAKLVALTQLTREQVEIGRTELASLYETAKASTLIVLAAAVILGLLSSIVIHRSITGPLNAFMGFVGRVGQGDLTQQAAVTRQDELGDLAGSLNEMVSGLKDVAIQTREATENLNAATVEILASTQQQAAGTSEQAAVQQTNATMAEISQSGSQISERAKQVASAAEATSAAGNAGLQALPKELSEAAKVDGANRWQSFWQITFPLMLPVSLA